MKKRLVEGASQKLLIVTVLVPAVFMLLFLVSSSPALSTGDVQTNCASGKPSMMVDYKYTYWASATDYAERKLTVIIWLKNNGASDAYNVVINDAIPDNGVTLVSPVPVTVGNIAAGQRGTPYTLVYKLPLLVYDFQVTSPSSGQDECGNSYSYSFVSQNHATLTPDEIT